MSLPNAGHETTSPPGQDESGENSTRILGEAFILDSKPASGSQVSSGQNHAHPSPPTEAMPSLDGTSERSTPSLGPRRGSFTSDVPLGHVMPPPVNDTPPPTQSQVPVEETPITNANVHTNPRANLAPNSDILPAHPIIKINPEDVLTDSDPDFMNSIPLNLPPRSTDSVAPQSSVPQLPQPPQGYYSTYKLEPNTQMPPPNRELTTSARRVKQYTLSDGTVVSGKGLGRGRPGVKRGPRNPKYTMVDPLSEAALSAIPPTLPPPPPYRNQSIILSAPSKKRKRTDSNASNPKTFSTSTSATSDSRESSPEYNGTEATRSGRHIQKPSSIITPSAESASPASKRPKLESNHSSHVSQSVIKHHPKIKRRLYRGREQLALCEHCLRGHGPSGNVIVFCDACNKCWHQRCHEPQVPHSLVSDSKAEWFCADCDRILHGGKKSKKQTSITVKPQQTPPVPTPAFSGPLIAGASLTTLQKQNYLHSLPKEKLITLILSASELAPTLPLFQGPAPAPAPLPLPKFTSNYTTPVTTTFQPNNNGNNSAATGDGGEEDEGYDSYLDDHAYLYPKPGQGVKLPPESTDLHMLLESRTSRTFSHWVKGMAGREYSGSGDAGGGLNGHSHDHAHAYA